MPQQLLSDTTTPGRPAGGTWQGDFDHTGNDGLHRIYRATVVVQQDDESTDDGFIGIITHDVTAAREEARQGREVGQPRARRPASGRIGAGDGLFALRDLGGRLFGDSPLARRPSADAGAGVVGDRAQLLVLGDLGDQLRVQRLHDRASGLGAHNDVAREQGADPGVGLERAVASRYTSSTRT